MKILYAVQGTGNGHLSRARDIIPRLQKRGEVDILISGCQADMSLPFDVKYCFSGLSFIFGKKGGIDYLETYKRTNLKQLFREINQVPVDDYDIIISDFEPVSAWACYLKNRRCIGLSHQYGVISKKAPRPLKTDLIGRAVLKYYAPATEKFGFHFLAYDKHVFTPVIRQEVRALQPVNKGHYTVYLPAYSDERIKKMLFCFPEIEWQVFSKHCNEASIIENVSIYPVHNERFLQSIASAEGVLCGAGFETPAEVLYLKKKLIVIPMKGQYEQQCNAAALKLLGVPVLKNFKIKQVDKIRKWLRSEFSAPLTFPDDTDTVIDMVINTGRKIKEPLKLKEVKVDSPSRFRELVLKKIFHHQQARS